MPRYTSYNVLGSSIQAGEIDSGAVTFGKLADVDQWELLEEMTLSSDASKTSGTLDAKDQYKVYIDLTDSHASSNLYIQFNGDTAGNYSGIHISAGTNTTYSSANQGWLGGTTNLVPYNGYVIVTGVTGAVASGQLGFHVFNGGYSSGQVALCGQWIGGNATQITSMTFGSSAPGSLSGTIKIYGR